MVSKFTGTFALPPPPPTPTPSSLHHHHSTAPRGAQPALPNQMFLAWCLVSLKFNFFPSRLCSRRFFFFLRISDVRSFPFFLSLVEIMTLPPAFQNKFKEIAAKYPTTRVPSKVMDELCKWCRVNKRVMSQASISNQISKARGVTVHNYLENAAGSVSSHSYEGHRLQNKINNPINNAKKIKERQKVAAAWLKKNGLYHYLLTNRQLSFEFNTNYIQKTHPLCEYICCSNVVFLY